MLRLWRYLGASSIIQLDVFDRELAVARHAAETATNATSPTCEQVITACDESSMVRYRPDAICSPCTLRGSVAGPLALFSGSCPCVGATVELDDVGVPEIQQLLHRDA